MTLQDEDKFPFGKYKGIPMKDVPASHYHWLWKNNRRDVRGDSVMEYIKRSLSALKKEMPDAIWD